MSECPSAIRQITRTARKEHRCCECRGFIQPGEKYHYCSGIWSGEPSDYKTCTDCEELRSQVIDDYELTHEDLPAFSYLSDCLEAEYLARFNEIRAKRRPANESK